MKWIKRVQKIRINRMFEQFRHSKIHTIYCKPTTYEGMSFYSVKTIIMYNKFIDDLSKWVSQR